MADRVYMLLEDKVLETLEGDATLLSEVTTFDTDGTKDPADFNEHELPAIQVEALGSATGQEDEEPVAISGRVEIHYQVAVYVMAQSGHETRRMQSIKNIVARVETVMRTQYGSNQMSGLDAAVQDADPGSVVTEVESSQIVEAEVAEHKYMGLSQTLLDVSLVINLED